MFGKGSLLILSFMQLLVTLGRQSGVRSALLMSPGQRNLARRCFQGSKPQCAKT